MKVPKSTVASTILNVWHNQESTKSWPAGETEQLGEKVFFGWYLYLSFLFNKFGKISKILFSLCHYRAEDGAMGNFLYLFENIIMFFLPPSVTSMQRSRL